MTPRLFLGILASTCVVLGAVRSGVGQAATGTKKVELSFWNGFTGPDGRTMLELIREFNQDNPDLLVSMQRMDWGTYYNKLMVAAVDGRGPQIFVIHASTLPRMERAGFVDDVRDLFTTIPRDDFDPYVLQQVQYGERFVGLPLDIHPQGLYVNAEMLKAIGMDAPPKNGDEFVKAARALKKDGEWGFALTLWRNNFQSLIPQFGGRYLDEQGNADLANPGNIRALEFLGSLEAEKLVPPPENGLGWVGYRQKKVGMVWDGVYMLGDLKRLDNLQYVGAPVPQIGPKPGTMADSHVLCVRKDLPRDQAEGARRFLRFLSANSIGWADAGQVPARRSVRAKPEFAKMQVQSAFAKQIPGMMYPPRTPVLFELTGEIDLAVEKVLRGRATAKEALTVASANAQKAIDRERSERGVKP